MKNKKLKVIPLSIVRTAFSILLWALSLYGCKKADRFYEKLDGQLQVDQSADYAYATNYVVGDTLEIYGLLKASQNLEVWVNNVQGTIVGINSVSYYTSERDTAYMDHVSVRISEDMIGNNVPVELRNGDLRGTGSSINVLSYYGEGSFEQELTYELTYTFPDRLNTFLYCASGKGDVYYYQQTDKIIRHIAKDGTATALIDLSQPLPDGATVQEFLAGGVDPNLQYLYFSVRTDQGYALYRQAIATQSLTLLNASADFAQPFTGTLDAVGIIVTRIYPDSNGNLYLNIGAVGSTSGELSALAYYAAADRSFTYLYKRSNVSGLPGQLLQYSTSYRGWRLNPEDKLLYIISYSDGTSSHTIDVYDLQAQVRRQTTTFTPSLSLSGTNFRVVSSFSGMNVYLGPANGDVGASYPDVCFGLMPMPGNRLQTLMYQYYTSKNESAANYGFPKWIVFDFANSRTYGYHKGSYYRGSNAFNPSATSSVSNSYVDELLNWDEDGQLYMSSNGKKVLLRTKTVD